MAAKTDEITKHYLEMLKIKDERDREEDKKIEYYAKFKEHLGRQQELSRQLNEKVEEGRVLVSRIINRWGV